MNPLLKLIIKGAASDSKKFVAKKVDPDFIPYVCHYDSNTILTKNGELMSIIRVAGFSSLSVISEIISLRDAVRDAITDHVTEDKFAFWFNTIRRKKNISPGVENGAFNDYFSKKINEFWTSGNEWDDQYVNELYITIITEGLDTSFTNVESFLRSFSYFTTKSMHRDFLEESHKKLSAITSKILNDLKDYGGILLGIKDWEGTLYSEPMRFFGKILNLYEERYPLVMNDISSELATHKVAFGDREIEVVGYNNKNFAAMLSLKEYFEVSTPSLDRILQLPFEFVITQSFDFTFDKKEIEPFEYQDNILRISGDDEFRRLSGIANFVGSNNGNPTDYGKAQTTLMVIAKTKDDLNKDIRMAYEQFSALGFVVVREDIFSEHCFWSQLPGNFPYLRRQKLLNTLRIGGFAALQSYSTGSMAGNHWGPAICVLKTILRTPYFFNFHDGDLGHTLIVGAAGSGKTVLTNFLLSQSKRINGKIFHFDFNRKSECFIRALNGSYRRLEKQLVGKDNFLKLNPLKLPKTPENKEFLIGFFTSVVSFDKGSIPAAELKAIPQIIDRILAANTDNFTAAIESFNTPETKGVYEKMKLWQGENLKHIFSSADEIDWSNSVHGFDFSEIIEQKHVVIPVFSYLMHLIENKLDGSPAIIVINQALDLLDNTILGPKVGAFLEKMRSKNCVVICTINDINQMATSEVTIALTKNVATEIFMPDKQLSDTAKLCYKEVLGLTAEEIEIVRLMDERDRHFLLKHGSDSIIASLDMMKFVGLLKMLSADDVTLMAMEEILNALKVDKNKDLNPEKWIPPMLDLLKEIEDDRLKEEKERQRELAVARRRKFAVAAPD